MTVLFLLEQQTLQKIDLADLPKGTPEINDIVTIEDNHYKVTGKLYHYLTGYISVHLTPISEIPCTYMRKNSLCGLEPAATSTGKCEPICSYRTTLQQ